MRFVRNFSKRYYFRHIFIYFLACWLFFSTSISVVLAGPEGAQVVNGQVSFQQSGYNTTITASDQSIINYTRFDITQPEIVQFIQPGSNASVLNRILSANPTMINGTLLANGRVFFINPAGVMIGGSARINVNQLVASGLNMSDSSFLNGQYEFAGGNGAVVNNGDIAAQRVYLVGKQVTNAGSIKCPDGYVVMAAGDRVFFGQPGSNIIVEVGSVEPLEQTNTQLSAEVINEGVVDAAGGTIILAVAGDALSRPMMSNVGSLSTSVAEGDAGNISLQADGGQIDNTGTITAKSDSGAGGNVTANAAEIVNSGTVDVSGSWGGTVVLEGTGRVGQFGSVNADGIEGDGGKVSLTAGAFVFLETESVTTANAGSNGDGGEVVAYSPGAAIFQSGSQLEARGGSQSGNGGFLEVSGHEYIEISGRVDTTAENGQTGMFLIDPRDIRIVDEKGPTGNVSSGLGWEDWDSITGTLSSSGNNSKIRLSVVEYALYTSDVTITTSLEGEPGDSDNDIGNIVFDAGRDLLSHVDWTNTTAGDYSHWKTVFGDDLPEFTSTNNSLTLIANNNIIFNAGSGIYFQGSGSVTLKAVNNVTIGADIDLNGGSFTSMNIPQGPGDTRDPVTDFEYIFDSLAGIITTSGGNIDISHTGAVTIGKALDATGGGGTGSVGINGSSITILDNIFAGGNITFYNAVTAAATNPLQMFDATGTLTAMGDITKTTAGTLTLGSGSGVLHLGHNVRGTDVAGSSITFNCDVFADGTGANSNQLFDATGTLTANGKIEKTTSGNLTLGGELGIGLDGVDSITGDSVTVADGALTIEDVVDAAGNLTVSGQIWFKGDSGTNYVAGDITGNGVKLSASPVDIILDGAASQLIDAGDGVLWANGTLTKTNSGSLTLSSAYAGVGSAVVLDGAVEVQTSGGDLIITDSVDAAELLKAAGSVDIEDDAILGGDVTALGGDIDFRGTVTGTGDGAAGQTFSASNNLHAHGTITKTGGSDLVLNADGTSPAIDLDGTVDVQTGSLTIKDDFTAAGDLLADSGITFNGSPVNGELDGASSQLINAGDGVLWANGTLTKTNSGSLTLSSAYAGVGSAVVLDGAVEVQTTGGDLCIVAGNDDIQLGGALESSSGGVSVISDNGKIYTGAGGDTLNVAITGYSNGTSGVDLPGGSGKAAIVIISNGTLKLGPAAKLTAKGTYDTTGSTNDRPRVDFLNGVEGDKNPGWPIDVAIYLASNAGNVSVSSPVSPVPTGGVIVIDAYQAVESFGSNFINSLAGIGWLEVCSRITPDLDYGMTNDTLPYADDPSLFPGSGKYVLRGEYPDVGTGAWVLEEEEEEEDPSLSLRDIVKASSIETPVSPDLGDIGQIQGAGFDNMQWLANELGLCEGDPQRGGDESRCQELAQAYLAGAFLQSTDLRPHQAATQLRNLVEILHDSGGTRIAALGRVVNEFSQPGMPPSPEQFASISQAFAQHTNDGTHYAAAGQWLDALTEYVTILNTDIGWSADESIAFVMGKYGTAITDAGDVSVTAFIQMHLEGISSE